MAEICSIDIKKNDILVNVKVSKDEYRLMLLLPTNHEFLNRPLTTGKLGNSNRIMLPKKILEKFEVKKLEKKAPARTFRIGDEVFLLVKLKKSTFGIPEFKEVKR
jgi:hypothetical protein